VKLAAVIVILAAIAVGLVHVRRAETNAHHRIQRLQLHRASLRRTLWDQQVRLGYLTAPGRIRRRSQKMALNLTEEGWAGDGLAANE